MKKAIALTIFAAMFAFVACGPSAKEKEAQEKARLDSIAKVEREAFVQDSLAKRDAFVKDSLAAREAFVKDSLANAAKKTTKPAAPKPAVKVTAGQGKG